MSASELEQGRTQAPTPGSAKVVSEVLAQGWESSHTFLTTPPSTRSASA